MLKVAICQSVPLSVSGGEGGGLTDAQLRASPVPVSGTVTANVGTVPVTGSFYQATQPVSGAFYPATQPISGSVTVSGSVAVTGAFYQATQPVSIASMPSTPVTGTFWQTTQPVSGTVTANAGSGTFAVSGTFWQATQPVSGTFWQATQPVSGTVTITPPTLTKGTQGATGVSTQDLKDAGRVLFSAATVIGGVAAVSTEALLSVVATRAGVAAGGATSLTVTANKTLRVTGIVAGVRSTGATVLSGRVALRMNPSGAAIATSPIIAILSMTQQAAALAEAGDTCVLSVPDGLEFSGTQQIGLTQVCSGTGGVVYASIVGFEY